MPGDTVKVPGLYRGEGVCFHPFLYTCTLQLCHLDPEIEIGQSQDQENVQKTGGRQDKYWVD